MKNKQQKIYEETNEKKKDSFLKRTFIFAIIIIPVAYLYQNKASWQMIAVVGIAIISALAIANYKEFELIKIGKEGVELRKNIEDAKNVLEELKVTATALIDVQLATISTLPIPLMNKLMIYNEVDLIIKKYNIKDKKIIYKMKSLEKNFPKNFYDEIEQTITSITSVLVAHVMNNTEKKSRFPDLVEYYNELVKILHSNIKDYSKIITPNELKDLTNKHKVSLEEVGIFDEIHKSVECYEITYNLYPAVAKFE